MLLRVIGRGSPVHALHVRAKVHAYLGRHGHARSVQGDRGRVAARRAERHAYTGRGHREANRACGAYRGRAT